MAKLFEGFKILCSDFDHILEKKCGTYSRGDIFQGRILIKEIRYVFLFGDSIVFVFTYNIHLTANV